MENKCTMKTLFHVSNYINLVINIGVLKLVKLITTF